MSTTKISGTRITSRISVPKQFDLIPDRSASKRGRAHPFPGFIDKGNLDTLNQFGEKFRLTGIDVSPDEFHELEVFDTFLKRHVQANRICDVQCMLLWNEWVLSFRRRISGFPNLIREKEFRNVITDKFGVEIANYDMRGAVYPGIKFVP